MAIFTYKCVPVSDAFETGKIGMSSHLNAVGFYEKEINQASAGGWELVLIDEVTSVQHRGCLGSLFGKKDQAITFKMLVFRKEQTMTAPPLPKS